jgi:nucleoside 2-deoxyribosyltransferase
MFRRALDTKRIITLIMAFKVFLSYSTNPEEHAIVWRLQTLAASNGIEFFVPPRNGTGTSPRGRQKRVVTSQARAAIDHADCVLAIITSRPSLAVEQELNYARSQGKLIVPIVEKNVPQGAFFHGFTVFTFSRLNGDAGKLESEIVEFLKRQKLDKEHRRAVGALVAIGMGMFQLSELPKK